MAGVLTGLCLNIKNLTAYQVTLNGLRWICNRWIETGNEESLDQVCDIRMLQLGDEGDDQSFVKVVVISGGWRQIATLFPANSALSDVNENILERFENFFEVRRRQDVLTPEVKDQGWNVAGLKRVKNTYLQRVERNKSLFKYLNTCHHPANSIIPVSYP